MGKTKKSVEVEVFYTCLVHHGDGIVEKVGWFDHDAEALIIGLLKSNEQGVRLVEIIAMVTGEDGPKTHSICCHGEMYLPDTDIQGHMDRRLNAVESLAMEVVYQKGGAPADEEKATEVAYALAEAFELLEYLPIRIPPDEDAIIDRAADTYHAQLLHDVIVSTGDERPNLDPSERRALLEFIDRRLGA
jgi:hypothetical protein